MTAQNCLEFFKILLVKGFFFNKFENFFYLLCLKWVRILSDIRGTYYKNHAFDRLLVAQYIMAERISDASKDVFWCLLCFAFVLLFSFLGILHKKCHKERECGWSISKKLFDHFFFQGDFVHDDSTWVTGTYKKVR